jgi:hypothetical protein
MPRLPSSAIGADSEWFAWRCPLDRSGCLWLTILESLNWDSHPELGLPRHHDACHWFCLGRLRLPVRAGWQVSGASDGRIGRGDRHRAERKGGEGDPAPLTLLSATNVHIRVRIVQHSHRRLNVLLWKGWTRCVRNEML